MKKILLFFGSVVLLTLVSNAQGNQIPLIGSKAPSFSAETTNGKLNFPQDYGKSWKILFSHPQDFTPVCSSELLELANLQNDFAKLNTKIGIISTDDLNMHKMWKAQLQELDYKGRGAQKIEFPIIDDHKTTVSKEYGMLHEPMSSNKDIRGVFIIDPKNMVRSVNFYPMQVGRNMQEIVRILEALQTSDEQAVLMPANWKPGDDVLMSHFPYTDKELADNPNIKDEFYQVGNRMWFKKTAK